MVSDMVPMACLRFYSNVGSLSIPSLFHVAPKNVRDLVGRTTDLRQLTTNLAFESLARRAKRRFESVEEDVWQMMTSSM